VSGIEIALVVSSLVIGLTGAWSPCGYSMVETIGPNGHCGGQRTTLSACATFTPGCLVGGAITFGALAWVGGLVQGAGEAAYVAAAVIAALAAIAEARGVPIVPQIRRQLPEHWRRVMPMPIAAALYGVLLGLGFTTFVLSFGVWALAGISFLLGDVQLGIAIGIAFGLGRAIPVIGLAPISDKPAGNGIIAAMAERPALYRGFRMGDAAMLTVVAAMLALSGPAASASTVENDAADPGIFSTTDLVFQRANQDGVLRRGGTDTPLPGKDPAIGNGYIAVRQGQDQVKLLYRSNPLLPPVATYSTPDVDAIAVSHDWLVWRAHNSDGDKLKAMRITNPASPGAVKGITAAGSPSQVGHPSLQGSLLLYAVATGRSNKIIQRSLGSGKSKTLVKSTSRAVQNPSILGKKFLYVSIDRQRQRLLLSKRRSPGRSRTLYSRQRTGARLWSTALSSKHGYVTLLTGSGPSPAPVLLRFQR
jgi:hypothetical protein